MSECGGDSCQGGHWDSVSPFRPLTALCLTQIIPLGEPSESVVTSRADRSRAGCCTRVMSKPHGSRTKGSFTHSRRRGGLVGGTLGFPIELLGVVTQEGIWPHGSCQKAGRQGEQQGQGPSEPQRARRLTWGCSVCHQPTQRPVLSTPWSHSIWMCWAHIKTCQVEKGPSCLLSISNAGQALCSSSLRTLGESPIHTLGGSPKRLSNRAKLASR